ncbi:hypothetical protein ACHAXR_011869 [Thalassiosira sp. AJA248-18]
MEADLILSRSSYQAGTPVVGTVRIRRAKLNDSSATGHLGQQHRHIRHEIVSARLYLAGRAHLGSNARGKVSRWRSMQEVNQLKKIYGEHACLTMAKVDEQSQWSEWNSSLESNDDDTHRDIAGNIDTLPTKATFCKPIQPPQVTHVEQAERLAVHSCLNHSSSSTKTINDGSKTSNTDGDAETSNDYSHLPTPHENNVICFWMTNVLELMDIPERHLDRKCACTTEENCQCQASQLRPGRGKFYGDMHPYRPLQLPDLNVVRDVWKGIENISLQKKSEGSYEGQATPETTTPLSAWEQIIASANPSNEASANEDTTAKMPLEWKQCALSFRADLSSDVPPTMSAECVKYFYSAVLVVTTNYGELLVTQCPFAVLTSNSQQSSRQQSHQASSTRVHIGDLHAIAHSAALPTYISSTEDSDATPTQINVVANPPACDIVSRRTAEQRTSTHRIEDGQGCLCGLMTLIGIGGPLVPGTRLGIRIRFPIYDDDENSNGAGVIPCHRVCCALVGEEYAIFEGASTSAAADNPQKRKNRVKSRSYVFDSAYEMVDFGYTEGISMGLVLPLDCPVTVKTDLVEVTVMLKVEFTVSRAATSSHMSDEGVAGSDQGRYSTIRLDLPCEVVHGGCGWDGYPEEGEENERPESVIRTMQQFWLNNDDKREGNGFDDTDIQNDLKMLEYASFCKNGQDPEISTMKYEMYARTREKLYQVASDERSKLEAKSMAGHNASFSTTDSVSIVSKSSMATSIDRKEQEVSTLIENEKRRLEKVAQRQQKELMRMLAFESKSKEIMDKMQAKTEEQAKKEEQRKKEKRKRDLQAAEEARLRELRRKAREDAEVSLLRQKMQEQFEDERKRRMRNLREEKESKKRACAEEQARLKRRESHRLHTERCFEQQRKETEKKMKEAQEKERDREKKLELKRLVDAQAAQAKRKAQEKRKEANRERNTAQQEEKRSSLLYKQARQKEFMDEIHREKQAAGAERLQRSQALHRKRVNQIKTKEKMEEETKLDVLSKIQQEDAHLKELAERRRKEQILLKAEKDLQTQMKQENLSRIKKAQEYHLKEMIQKAEANDRRCQDLKKRKQDLLVVRRKKAHEANIKRDRLMSVIEKSRYASGSSGIKKILKSVSANTEFKQVSKQNMSPDAASDASSLGPPPEAPFLKSRFETEHSPRAPYKSPYVSDDLFTSMSHISINVTDSPLAE